ncbi:MAG: NAD(P)H-hydrate dehydratase, partial [Pseudomonadota bacterium]
ALFGAGLSKPISAEVAKVLKGIQENQWDVVAVDLPSGVDGKTGEVMGTACPAQLTVAFHRAKVGHLLGEGPALCGSLFVRDIGMTPLPEDACAVRNCPALWSAQLPYPPKAAHKYARGGVFVVGGPRHQTGAARLTAEAAARAGAGAVILGAAPSAIDIYAAHLTAIMVAKIQNEEDLRDLAQDKRVAAMAIGPGLSLGEQARAQVLTTCQVGKPMVIDADGLSLLTSSSSDLFSVLPEICVLTPHEGEFARIFPDLRGDALSRAQAAADRCGRTVLLKGATTVIASPGRLPILNTHATPYLATAGAGDVLTGIIVSLLAQGLPAHEAAAAGAYIHGDAARRLGPGLTADDLSKGLKPTLEILSALS